MEHKQQFTVIPAILKKEFKDIIKMATLVSSRSRLVQIDIIDGVFAGEPTWPFSNVDEIHYVRTLLETLPVAYELDIMVQYPEKTLPLWLSVSAKRLIFHFGSTNQMEKCLTETKRSGKEAVVALLPQHNVSVLKPWKKLLDGVQCMGIEEVGKQGMPFSERVFDTIAAVRTVVPKASIGVDGGVSLENIKQLRDAGVTRFAVGSALFQSKDIESTITTFEEAVAS